MNDRQEIMNHFCAIVLMTDVEERRKALEQAPEHQREEIKKRVSEYFAMRAQRRIASDQCRAARELREATEKRRKAFHGR